MGFGSNWNVGVGFGPILLMCHNVCVVVWWAAPQRTCFAFIENGAKPHPHIAIRAKPHFRVPNPIFILYETRTPLSREPNPIFERDYVCSSPGLWSQPPPLNLKGANPHFQGPNPTFVSSKSQSPLLWSQPPVFEEPTPTFFLSFEGAKPHLCPFEQRAKPAQSFIV